ncbi:MAG: methyltransferase domain-containing protein [Myxococcota bacterium]|jgi:demethylmenaquinone methyltransferase/2-methoxy-6-polyprenyl-1,4-benzoquinol methylase|nr:methyltransferase domain-containing protein [Myxococcota bacterium]
MGISAQDVERIYTNGSPRTYDAYLSRTLGKYKKRAFADSSLQEGDRVLVFCCGTGLDFPFILERVGAKGAIVGVDFSPAMLGRARERVEENSWQNVELIEADVTNFAYTSGDPFDAGVCTLGISIIPDCMAAYRNLVSHVRPQGHVVVGDMQLASAWEAIFNPLTVFLSRDFGGSHTGHENSAALRQLMKSELADVRTAEFFLGSYFYCVGRVAGPQ